MKRVLPCEETGTGPAVVLLHAGIADRTMWTELLPAIAAAGGGHRVIAPDLPGFGEAPLVGGVADHDAVLRTLDALGVEDAVLAGVSLGGAVALRVAVVAPERVRSLVLVSAPAPGAEPSAELRAAWAAEEEPLERGDVDAAVAGVVDAWTLPGAPAALRERIARMQRRAFELQLGFEAEETEDPLDEPGALERVSVPALVAAGEHDLPDFRAGAEVLARALRAPAAVTIPGAGHLAPLEQPERFLALLGGHLRHR